MVEIMYVVSILFSILAIALLLSAKFSEQDKIKMANVKATKEEIKAFEVFKIAMEKGLELTINGDKVCKSAGDGWFYVNGEKKLLTIQSYLEILKGE